jgi:HAD superfamily phosphoserine phosphatase-like hydrolase
MVSVIIPALNEAARVGNVVRLARQSPLVDEVLVVDDGSIDGTPEIAQAAGARVITSTLLGKGASMDDGLRATRSPYVLYLDGDLASLRPGLVETMVEPLLADRADFVKARFRRASGRVTVLTALPLLEVFFPELSGFAQPLGGIVAARRTLLERLRFETDYGVDLGLLIDAAASGGRVCEATIGFIDHEPQTLGALAGMARQVVRTLLDRAHRYGRLRAGQCVERGEEPSATPESVLDPLRGACGIALFDMDGTLLQGRFVEELARVTRRTRQLARWMSNDRISPEERTGRIARVFAGVPRETFETVARSIPLTPGAVDAVVGLRRAGYRAGIVSESFRIAAEIVRRRVFADFSIGHLLRFRSGAATGEAELAPLLRHEHGCASHWHCKRNVLDHLRERLGIGADRVIAVGDGASDECLLAASGESVAFEPKSLWIAGAARQTLSGDLSPMLDAVLGEPAEAAIA